MQDRAQATIMFIDRGARATIMELVQHPGSLAKIQEISAKAVELIEANQEELNTLKIHQPESDQSTQ